MIREGTGRATEREVKGKKIRTIDSERERRRRSIADGRQVRPGVGERSRPSSEVFSNESTD